jgi:hypothetical protein
MGLSKILDRDDVDLRRFVEEHRSQELLDPPVRCPAGLQVSRHVCLCRIEGHLIEARNSPNTYFGRCTRDYDGCPTWRADNPREEL